MAITQADLKTKIITIGYYSNSGNVAHEGPALKDASGTVGTAASRHEHFTIPSNHIVSYTTQTMPDGSLKVMFGPPKRSSRTDLAVFLPFLPNCISSAVLNDRADRFFTDNLSGCSIFIDRLPNGDLVVHHANATEASPTAEQVNADPAYEREAARSIMRQLHTDALRARWPAATELTVLFKGRYNRAAGNFVNVHRWAGNKNVLFYGGTTVVGFRTGRGTWEFWYQTFGGDGIHGAKRVLCAERFYP